jgi:hypothetical protein
LVEQVKYGKEQIADYISAIKILEGQVEIAKGAKGNMHLAKIGSNFAVQGLKQNGNIEVSDLSFIDH